MSKVNENIYTFLKLIFMAALKAADRNSKVKYFQIYRHISDFTFPRHVLRQLLVVLEWRERTVSCKRVAAVCKRRILFIKL